MQNDASIRHLSNIVADLRFALDPQANPTFRFLIEALHERGFGLMLLIFAAPMAVLPVPPGINVILGTPLAFLTAQQMMGRHTIRFPERLLNKPGGSRFLPGVSSSWARKQLTSFAQPSIHSYDHAFKKPVVQ